MRTKDIANYDIYITWLLFLCQTELFWKPRKRLPWKSFQIILCKYLSSIPIKLCALLNFLIWSWLGGMHNYNYFSHIYIYYFVPNLFCIIIIILFSFDVNLNVLIYFPPHFVVINSEAIWIMNINTDSWLTVIK